MRNLIFPILLIGLSISCTKETAKLPCPQPTGGNMVVGDSTFTLHPTVIIANMGENTNGFFNDSTDGLLYLVHFLDSRLTRYSDTTFYPPEGVRAAVITLPCYTSNPDRLPVGIYKFSNTQPYPVNSFSWGMITYIYHHTSFSNYNFRYPKIAKGTLAINHICGDSYSIALNAELEDGGRFQGSISTNIITEDVR